MKGISYRFGPFDAQERNVGKPKRNDGNDDEDNDQNCE